MLQNTQNFNYPLWQKIISAAYTWGYNSNGLNTFQTLKAYSFLNKSQWESRERLENYQLSRLCAILKYADKNVPYYTRLFKNIKFKPENLKSFEDLERLPILTKEDVIKNFDRLISRQHVDKKNLIRRTTGGTTGKPLPLFLSYDTQIFFNACKIRGFSFAGVKNYHKKINLGSSTIPYPCKSDHYGVYNIFERSLDFSSVHMSPKTLENYVGQILSFKPKFIRGFSSAIYLLALFLKEKNIALNLEAAITRSEKLLEFQRKLICKEFGCDVFDYYGLNEDVCSAMECCKHNGHHIDMEKGIIEIVKNDVLVKPGIKGEIIATSLHNFAMPLIRYKTEDLGTISKKECSCGRGLSLLGSVDGRVADIMALEGNVTVPPTEFTIVVKNVKNIKECQFIQISEKEILVRLVKRKEFTKKDRATLIQNILRLVGHNIKVSLEFTDFIKREKNGKFKFVISKLSSERIKNIV